MTAWHLYLLAASGLSLAGYVSLEAVPTLLLGAALFAGLRRPGLARPSARLLLAGLAAWAALALLWRDSFLPPVSTLAAFLVNPKTRPTLRYLLEFTWQFLSLRMLAAAAVLAAAGYAASLRRPRAFALAAYAVFLGAWLHEPPRAALHLDEGAGPPKTPIAPRPNLAQRDDFYQMSVDDPPPGAESQAEAPVRSPRDFYEKESGRSVLFPAPAKDSPAFDILILHICSLSWKDIKDSGADLTAFFARFDYVFTAFSSASSYSGPAALRVLKSPCGQVPHIKLYEPAPDGCYLMDDLRRSGFKTFTMFSHDGKFDDFGSEVQKFGHADAPLPIAGLPVAYEMFDGTPMYSDAASLRRFWKARQESRAPRAALYYNTANLHVGTHLPGTSIGPDIGSDYRRRLETLARDIDGFLAELERSGRRAVVVVVPEHGAAIVGNKMQAQDVRDIPLPPITTIPVGVRLLGRRGPRPPAQVVDKPASLLAIAWLLADFIRRNPFADGAPDPEAIVKDIPSTEFMAESENSAVMRLGGDFIYQFKGGDWKPVPEYALLPAGTIPAAAAFRRTTR